MIISPPRLGHMSIINSYYQISDSKVALDIDSNKTTKSGTAAGAMTYYKVTLSVDKETVSAWLENFFTNIPLKDGTYTVKYTLGNGGEATVTLTVNNGTKTFSGTISAASFIAYKSSSTTVSHTFCLGLTSIKPV